MGHDEWDFKAVMNCKLFVILDDKFTNGEKVIVHSTPAHTSANAIQKINTL